MQNVSWGLFLALVSVTVIIYYIIIGIRFYYKDIKEIWKRGWKPPDHTPGQGDDRESEDGMEGNRFDELDRAVATLQAAFREMAGNNTGKQELLQRLQQELANYAGLRQPAIRAAVEGFISEKAQEHCGIYLDDDDLEAVWA